MHLSSLGPIAQSYYQKVVISIRGSNFVEVVSEAHFMGTRGRKPLMPGCGAWRNCFILSALIAGSTHALNPGSMISMAAQADVSQFAGLPGCPRLGLGLAAVGRPGYINLGRDSHVGDASKRTVDVMKKQSHDVMDAAWESGIRYFDAARSYGKAEEFLSSWLKAKSIAKADIAVGSKWGYRYTAGWRVDTGGEPHEVKDHSRDHFLSQSVETLGLLEEHLRLYQIHSATLESGVLTDPAVLDELRKFKTAKGVRLGLSLSGVKQAETLRTALAVPMKADDDPANGRLFDCVQATWNLLEQSAGEALEEARSAGLDVIIKEAMANGRLLSGLVGDKVAQKAAAVGCSGDALCLAAVMAQPFRPMVLSGAATVEQVRSNAGALAVLRRLQEDGDEGVEAAIEALKSELKVEAQAYWDERSGLSWN